MRTFVLIFIFFSFIQVRAQDTAFSTKMESVTKKCYQIINGEVRDRTTDDLLPNTVVTLLSADGSPKETLMVLEDASFSFKVGCDKDYQIKASKDDYTPESRNFTTTQDAGVKLKTKIYLDKGSIDFITASKHIEAKKNTTESINKTNIDAVNIKQPTINLDKKEEPEVKSVESKELKKEVLINKIDDKVTINIEKNNVNRKELVLKPVLFDYESSYLNTLAKSELKKVVDLMKKNPNIVLECASYTDSKGTEAYNMWMSERRAKRTVDFIVARGIDRSRISGKGYGEAKLLNHCTENIECSDEERAINRRTEFIIIKE